MAEKGLRCGRLAAISPLNEKGPAHTKYGLVLFFFPNFSFRFLKPDIMSNSRRFSPTLFLIFLAALSFSHHLKAQITEETYHRAEYFLTNSIQKEIYHFLFAS